MRLTEADKAKIRALRQRGWIQAKIAAEIGCSQPTVGCVLDPLYQQRWYKANMTPTRLSWKAIKQRCTNPNHKDYEAYGGRGITVCDRWRYSFDNFLADMGERPEGKTIDRIDVNGNYEPGNCRWATLLEQAHNRRPAAA